MKKICCTFNIFQGTARFAHCKLSIYKWIYAQRSLKHPGYLHVHATLHNCMHSIDIQFKTHFLSDWLKKRKICDCLSVVIYIYIYIFIYIYMLSAKSCHNYCALFVMWLKSLYHFSLHTELILVKRSSNLLFLTVWLKTKCHAISYL